MCPNGQPRSSRTTCALGSGRSSRPSSGCSTSGPRGLLVAGEPGIGKTSVCAAAMTTASDRGYLVLATRGLSFAGLTDLLDEVADRLLLAQEKILLRRKAKREARTALEAAGCPLGAAPFARLAAAELPRASGELTKTERKVAELVATGLTNREVASRGDCPNRTKPRVRRPERPPPAAASTTGS
ncbi:AAA family ATPase [Actinocrispum sp. NPDC049592]|uniref:AAA family ATPase n=1 Tax=Actinocrispum sp. NPDC049592 TaxID=3154835 RepID=UPI0034314DF9